MGAIPTQRESGSGAPAPAARPHTVARTSLPGNSLAPGAARRFVRTTLAEWTELALPGAESVTDRLVGDAVVVVSELVTNAVVHAGTDVDLMCRLDNCTDDCVVAAPGSTGAARGSASATASGSESGTAAATASEAAPGTAPGVAPTAAPGTASGATSDAVAGAVSAATPTATAETATEVATETATEVASETASEVASEIRRATPHRAGASALVIEVSDHHPERAVRDDGAERPHDAVEYGRGLRLVSALSDAWGITYRTGTKTVWARLPVAGVTAVEAKQVYETQVYGTEGHATQVHETQAYETQTFEAEAFEAEAYEGEHALRRGQRAAEILAHAPRRSTQEQDWLNRGALSFLAEASDLLAGQLDEDLIAALTGQLVVPRLADWCAVWLEDEAPGRSEGGVVGGPRLARVWHGSENRMEELRQFLEKDPPELPESARAGPVPVTWPAEALGARAGTGSALAFRLIAGGRPLGALVIGRAGQDHFPDEITGLVEDLSRRVALAIGAARQYARQATISRVLQRGLLPGAVAEIPGMRSALVYEPCDKGGPSGDFYDLFPAGAGRWCFALGDVQGKGPEAAVVIGLARPWLRLLAREGYAVPDVLDRLNQLLLDDATETADAAARALVAAGGQGLTDEGPQTRFLSLLYGELVPLEDGVRCTMASAGHPLPLLLEPSGKVCEVAQPQTLLGVFEDAGYHCDTFELRPGDSILCVTDGVTERRNGPRQFDDEAGLADALTGCAGLSAELIAERIRRLVHEFGGKPPEDDLALLVLQAE
ncbi:serine phosphatase RsbU (regulator of sigma subunit) [Streptomyces aurantiacus]|uniref:SpoIIE family protein phosphatase n=1 Tax=Streptomyces aurantiacus TaxID=47760 RepID=UPI00278D4EBC|nr:SpoIIE family protein phosphatase [Streptomyces aurantiacus]MDQ0777326.1 serine phosphatase RsbU (regulator of sigma subunit) [Streptomyces aurantiacus]